MGKRESNRALYMGLVLACVVLAAAARARSVRSAPQGRPAYAPNPGGVYLGTSPPPISPTLPIQTRRTRSRFE
ncbi:MAG: hypothetical protein GY711_16045 [bacterium]|nr:hypothetical protein [bacterium]